MCGHVGVAGDLRTVDVSAFKDMLLMDSVRGMHSTGVAAIGKDADDTVIIKQAVNGGTFIESFWHKNLDLLTNRALIGHNRHATRGKVCLRNAHPFMAENGQIVGAHNGTLDLAAVPKLPGVRGSSYGTDSEALINSIAEAGAEEALETAHGAWALVWYDFTDNSLYFHKNYDEVQSRTRPMWVCFSEDGRRVYWSSEMGILLNCLGRHGIEHSKAFPLRPDRLVRLKVDPTKEFDEPVSKTVISGKPPRSFSQAGSGTKTSPHGSTNRPPPVNQQPGFVSLAERRRQQEISKTRLVAPPQASDEADTAEGMEISGAMGPDGKAMSKNQAKKAIRNAQGGSTQGAPCSCCSTNVTKNDNFIVLPVGNAILCEDCGTDPALLNDLNQQLGLNLGVA